MINTTKIDTPYYTSEGLNPILNGLILYCTSDNSDYIWIDLSGYNHVINTTNTTRVDIHPSLTLGKRVRFNGILNYANITPAPIIGDKTQWTISIWYKSTSTVANGSLYMEGSTIIRNPSLGIKLNYASAANVSYPGSVRFKYTDNNSVDGSLTSPNVGANDGEWHEITAVQYNKSSRELFFDGISVATNTSTVGSMSLIDTSTMGALMRSVLEDYLQCDIGRIVIYNRSLLLSEIQYNRIHSAPYYIKNDII